jgi:hypothetical protein
VAVPELRATERSVQAGSSVGAAPEPIALVAPEDVSERLAALGRTEDVWLSPNGKRLAIACYAIDRIAVADIALTASEVRISRLELLSSPALGEPHGVDFLDHQTVVVAGRRSGLGVFRLPAAEAPPGAWEVAPLLSLPVREPHDTPGSVVARRVDADTHELLVCVNWAHEVRRHTLTGERVSAGTIAARRWLEVPDGVAVSGDGAWTAVSSHATHTVHVYDTAALGEDAEPVGVLRGATYPHGLRFAADDSRLLVADAGAPYVHVFAAADGGWHGVSYPAATIRVLDDDAFTRFRTNPQEGGPKGIEVDPRTMVLAVTSEAAPLSCFDVAGIVERPWEARSDPEALLRYELESLAAREDLRSAAAAVDAGVRARLAAIEGSLTWRLTEPARSLYRSVRRLATRR